MRLPRGSIDRERLRRSPCQGADPISFEAGGTAQGAFEPAHRKPGMRARQTLPDRAGSERLSGPVSRSSRSTRHGSEPMTDAGAENGSLPGSPAVSDLVEHNLDDLHFRAANPGDTAAIKLNLGGEDGSHWCSLGTSAAKEKRPVEGERVAEKNWRGRRGSNLKTGIPTCSGGC